MGRSMARADRPWWETSVVYQVYPRSFADSDGDGVGDLAGITARLEHLAWLGVDAVWLSPFYRSPMRDFGYDISDHTDVDPLFGTLADFDALLARAHELGLALIVDYVPEPHVERPSLVPGLAVDARRPAPRLVRLARSRAGRRPAEQLGLDLGRARLGVGRAHAAVLAAHLPR